MPKRSAGHYFLEGLVDLDLDYIFANLGTDHITLVEELARWERDGRKAPKVVLCPHENVAVHMAGGYALATGKGQAVVVHVDAGTANSAMGLHNLARNRLPVLLVAGKAPHTMRGELPGSRDSYIHFVQDPFDIASLVRPYVKWEYNLPSGVVVKEALRRAHAMMQSDPPGPVYMTLPRETLAEEWDEAAIKSFPAARYGAVAAGGIDPARAEAVADALMAADHPIAITSYLGRKPEAPALLEALALAAGIRVVEYTPVHLNIRRDSPCFAGFDPVAAMATADLGLLLDVDVPWIPKFAPRAEAIRWLQVDVDPVKQDFPMWGFPADLRIQGDCAAVLRQVIEIVRPSRTTPIAPRSRAASPAGLTLRAAALKSRAAAAADPGGFDALSPAHVCAVLSRKLGETDILVNEAVRNAPVAMAQIPRMLPHTYFGSAGGGLGFSGGAALGLKLARPERRVVQIVGDGVFHFSSPDAVYAVAQQYKLPIFTLVLDNRGWQAVKESVLRVYPEGAAKAGDSFQSRLDGREQGMVRRFDEVARAFGAYGETVKEPGELSSAIDRCLAAVDAGKAAVLNVRVKPL